MSDLEENDDNIASVSDIDKDKIDHVGGKSEPSARECPKVEAESDSGDLPIKASNSVPQKEEVEKASELLQLPDERAMRSDTVNESDGSDIMEQDVSIVPWSIIFGHILLNEAALPFDCIFQQIPLIVYYIHALSWAFDGTCIP